MDKKYLCAAGLIVALASSCLSVSALAATDDDNAKFLGETATPSTAARTIAIKPDTTWVEVKDGEVVNFAVDRQTFAWHFNGSNTLSEIDLNKIAPEGILNHLVKVYISRPPAD